MKKDLYRPQHLIKTSSTAFSKKGLTTLFFCGRIWSPKDLVFGGFLMFLLTVLLLPILGLGAIPGLPAHRPQLPARSLPPVGAPAQETRPRQLAGRQPPISPIVARPSSVTQSHSDRAMDQNNSKLAPRCDGAAARDLFESRAAAKTVSSNRAMSSRIAVALRGSSVEELEAFSGLYTIKNCKNL